MPSHSLKQHLEYVKTPTNPYERFMNVFLKLVIDRFPNRIYEPSIKGKIISMGNNIWNQVPKENKESLLSTTRSLGAWNNFTLISNQVVLSTYGYERLTLVTPKPTVIENKLESLNRDIDVLNQTLKVCSTRLATSVRKERVDLMKEKHELLIKKRKNIMHAQAQKRYHQKTKGKKIGNKGERKVPDLAKIITSIVDDSSSAEVRRRTNTITVHLSGTEIFKRVNNYLKEHNLPTVSESTVRRAMKPKRSRSKVGRTHYNDATIKLSKAKANNREEHVDSHYCFATVKYIKEIAELIGKESAILSVDKKKNIDLYGPATSRSYLMAQGSKVSFNDHTFPCPHAATIGPNVVLECLPVRVSSEVSIKQGKSFLTLRSNETHPLTKLENIIDTCNAFKGIEDYSSKSILVIFCDGHNVGDPCNRFNQALYYLLMREFDLDAIIVATHAPGYSAFNPVEHLMNKISYALKGCNNLLSKEEISYHKTDLPKFLKCVDSQLQFLEKLISENVSNMKVNKVLTDGAEVCFAGDCREDIPEMENLKHYFEGRMKVIDEQDKDIIDDIVRSAHNHSVQGNGAYCFCLRKCNNPDCCKPKRATKYWELLAKFDGFVPHPIMDDSRSSDEKLHYLPLSKRVVVEGVGVDVNRPGRDKKKNFLCVHGCGRLLHSLKEATFHYRLCHTVDPFANMNVLTTPINERSGYRIARSSINGRSQQHLFDSLVAGEPLTPRRRKRVVIEGSPMEYSPTE